MVLAAGWGRRLRPLTVETAKPVLPVMGRPLLGYTMAVLQRARVRDVVVNLHHHPESVRRALSGMSGNDFRIHYSLEPEILGTAGGLKRVEAELNKGTFFLVNGDTLLDADLTELVAWHRDRRAEATLLLRAKPTGSDYTGLGLDGQARIESVGEADRGPFMFAGVWALEPSVLGRLAAGKRGSLEVDLLPELVRERKAFGLVREIVWFDIGTPKRYLRACLNVARHGFFRSLWKAHLVPPTKDSSPDSIVVAGEGTSVDSSARFSGEAVLGADCRVERGVLVHNSVFWDRVTIGESSEVRNSIVAEGVTVAPGSRIQNKVIMTAPGERLDRVRAREVMDGYVVAEIKH